MKILRRKKNFFAIFAKIFVISDLSSKYTRNISHEVLFALKV
jgi:hypothetical protein